MVLAEFMKEWNAPVEELLVHTSGSTGIPKPMWVSKKRMEASARITCGFLGLKPGDSALLCLPLDYIAGKMMVVRSIVGGLNLVDVTPDGHPMLRFLEKLRQESETVARGADSDCTITLAAMVPMQVYNSLQVPEERETLCRIRHLIIGGGAIDRQLADRLEDFPHAVWSTYGMTETLSHIALRRMNGETADEWYTPFDSVKVSLSGEGCLVIRAPQVCPETLVTNDMAEMAPDNRRFRIIGRKDNVVCSGGVKIQMEQVEELLRPHLSFPYIVTKRPDRKFGEVVVLLAAVTSGGMADAKTICQAVLPSYWQPRVYLPVSHVPFTETGKPNRAEALRLAAQDVK